MSEEIKLFLTVKEVADIFGKNEYTIREWAQKGYINSIRVGKEWLFPRHSYIKSTQKDIKCALCPNIIHSAADFKDNISRKEFAISGLCQSCQDLFFDPSSGSESEEEGN